MRKILILLGVALMGVAAKSQSLTFSSEIQLTNVQPYQYNSVEVCSFNNNSELIDFLATYSNKLVWYETDYNQTVTEHLIDQVSGGSYPHFIAAKACQLVNDYSNVHDDIIALYRDDDVDDIKLVTYTNDGSNNFSSANIISSTLSMPVSLTVADVNHDYCADILVASDGYILLFLNDGSGNFTSDTIVAGEIDYPPFIKTADLNGDNNIDIITNTNNDLQWLAGDGAGNFGAAQTLNLGETSPVYNILIKDFDGDGDKDIVTQNSTNTTKLYKNDGSENFTFDHEIFAEADSWTTSMAPGNYDGTWSSEYNDILTGVSSNGDAPQITLLINDDSGNFIDTIQFETSSDTIVNLFSIDYNFDTCMDVVAATCYSIVWFKGTSCNTTTSVNELNKESELSFYPNPAKEVLHINNPDGDSKTVEIKDITGKTVKTVFVSENKQTINLSNLYKGI